MSFVSKAIGSELQYVAHLIEIFRVVETAQMRILFSFLEETEYELITTSLQRQGLLCFSSDMKYMAVDQPSLKGSGIADRINCFWAFIYLKDKVTDFSVGTAPSIITLSSELRVYEIVPLSEATIDEINTAATRTNSCAIRVFATTSPNLAGSLFCAEKNDFVIDVADASAPRIYML